jgi:hypothetical protein
VSDGASAESAAIPAAFRRPPLAAAFAAVCTGWLAAWTQGSPSHPSLDLALDVLADTAQAHRQLIMDVFEAINSVPPRERDGDGYRAWDLVRQHIGKRLIQRYYAPR